jgi:uncharacterized protein (TIGR02246 family)
MLKLPLLLLLALPLLASDIESDIAKLNEGIDAAWKAHDRAAMAKLLTDDFHATTVQGAVRDLQAQLASVKNSTPPPADLKTEIVKTTVYGDTVLRIAMESYTMSTVVKRQVYRNEVYVKQSGVWRLASRAATIVTQ